jgi:hypothetical protein
MMTKEPIKRRTIRASIGAHGTLVKSGALELKVEAMPEGLHADGLRYGPMGLVALEVVGVPVRRKPAIDDELSWLWAREARLEAVKAELAAARQWCEWELICGRLARVYARSEELWRRWREGAGAVANGVCKSLVVVGEGRGA